MAKVRISRGAAKVPAATVNKVKITKPQRKVIVKKQIKITPPGAEAPVSARIQQTNLDPDVLGGHVGRTWFAPGADLKREQETKQQVSNQTVCNTDR